MQSKGKIGRSRFGMHVKGEGLQSNGGTEYASHTYCSCECKSMCLLHTPSVVSGKTWTLWRPLLWGKRHVRAPSLRSGCLEVQPSGTQLKRNKTVTHLYLLRPPLVCSLVLVIDAAKVGHDDRDGQGNYQHPTQRADRAKDLPRNRLRNHVSVPARGDREKERINLL